MIDAKNSRRSCSNRSGASCVIGWSRRWYLVAFDLEKADSVQSMAVHLSLLDADFVVRNGPPELTDYLQRLAERYRRATSS
ncbi:hypothetical protein ACXC9Q_06060 [Kribbella sp. CWNU-51]